MRLLCSDFKFNTVLLPVIARRHIYSYPVNRLNTEKSKVRWFPLQIYRMFGSLCICSLWAVGDTKGPAWYTVSVRFSKSLRDSLICIGTCTWSPIPFLFLGIIAIPGWPFNPMSPHWHTSKRQNISLLNGINQFRKMPPALRYSLWNCKYLILVNFGAEFWVSNVFPNPS